MVLFLGKFLYYHCDNRKKRQIQSLKRHSYVLPYKKYAKADEYSVIEVKENSYGSYS